MLFSGCSKSLKNMCSVRHSPMPSAPISRARRASCGVSALVRTPSLRILSAHFISVSYAFGGSGRIRSNLPAVDRAVATIERDPFALAHRLARRRSSFLASRINVDLLGADDAALSPAARHDRRMARLPARGRENSLRHVHAAHIFRAGFAAHQNHLLAARGPVLRPLPR